MADPQPLLHDLEEVHAQLDRTDALFDNLEQRVVKLQKHLGATDSGLEEVLGKTQNDKGGMPAQMTDTITSGKAWAVVFSKAISLELQVVSWLNKKLMPHSDLEALPAEVVALKDAPFKIVCGGKPSDLVIPSDPRVLKMHVENYGEHGNTFGTQCAGPAYMYSVLACCIVHTSVFVLSALVFIFSKCQSQSAVAIYPFFLLVPVALTALATCFLEVQALKYYVLPKVLLTKCLKLPLIGPVSYWKWACYNGMMTCLGVTNQHTAAFAVAQTLKGYGFCNAQQVEETWSDMMKSSVFGQLPINWKIFNPAILLLMIWLLGLYPVWRAWLQSVTFPWITSGKFFFIRTWTSDHPGDILHLKKSEEKGILNYAPQLVMGRYNHKKEIRWRSLANKLKFEEWETNFTQGLHSNSQICNWTSIASMVLPVEVAKARDVLDTRQNKFWENKCVDRAYEIQLRMMVRIVGFVFLRGLLVIHLKINVFDLQQEDSGHDQLTISQVQMLGSILLSIGFLCLTEITQKRKAMLTAIESLRGAQKAVQEKRMLLAERETKDPERFKRKELSDGEKKCLILIGRYDKAWSETYKVAIWILLCALLLIYAVIKVCLAVCQ